MCVAVDWGNKWSKMTNFWWIYFVDCLKKKTIFEIENIITYLVVCLEIRKIMKGSDKFFFFVNVYN